MHPVERYRKGKGLTQAKLASAVGVSLHTVQRWEGGAEPRPSKLVKVAEVLGVEPMQLLDEMVAWKTGRVAFLVLGPAGASVPVGLWFLSFSPRLPRLPQVPQV